MTRRMPRAFTLVEVAAATLMIGVLFTVALDLISRARASQVSAANRLLGTQIAAVLMAEVLPLPFVDPQDASLTLGPNAAESHTTRTTLDDVDDYHGMNAVPVQMSGAALASIATETTRWRWSVRVEYVDAIDSLAAAAAPTRHKRITVEVRRDGGLVATLIGLRTQGGGP